VKIGQPKRGLERSVVLLALSPLKNGVTIVFLLIAAAFPFLVVTLKLHAEELLNNFSRLDPILSQIQNARRLCGKRKTGGKRD
jgi:hypothetical protein